MINQNDTLRRKKQQLFLEFRTSCCFFFLGACKLNHFNSGIVNQFKHELVRKEENCRSLDWNKSSENETRLFANSMHGIPTWIRWCRLQWYRRTESTSCSSTDCHGRSSDRQIDYIRRYFVIVIHNCFSFYLISIDLPLWVCSFLAI